MLARGVLRAAALWLALAPFPASAREKSDLVVLNDGSTLYGEIMGLSRGKLDYKTDSAGRPSIEWLKVVRVASKFTYTIETSSGVRYYSSLHTLPADGQGAVQLDDGKTIPIEEIVSLVPLNDGFFSRLSAYLDLGLTLAKANSAVTLTSDGFVGYRGERLGTSFQYNLYVQSTSGGSTALNNTLQLIGDLYAGRWTSQLGLQSEQNSELDLKLRLTLAAGEGYSAIQSNTMTLFLKAGLAGISERYTTGDPSWYLTAYVGGAWDAFRYDHPKLDAGISVDVYPYLTDFGRVRLQSTIRVKYEIFRDFNIGLNLTDTFDSRPPQGGSNNDYNLSFTVGWSYRT